MQQERDKVHFEGSNTIITLLMAPKDKDTKLQTSGVIYNTSAHKLTVLRSILERLAGHLGQAQTTSQSPIHQHTSTTGHPISPACFSIVQREAQGTTRNIKGHVYQGK